MPFESLSDEPLRRSVSYLEAVGRTVCGIAPWLELGPDDTQEGVAPIATLNPYKRQEDNWECAVGIIFEFFHSHTASESATRCV